MRVRLTKYFKMRSLPFWVIGLCGLVGVLVDLDHPITYWITGHASRAAHLSIAVVSGLVLCSVIALCGGLFFKMVLTRYRKQTAVSGPLASEADGNIKADI